MHGNLCRSAFNFAENCPVSIRPTAHTLWRGAMIRPLLWVTARPAGERESGSLCADCAEPKLQIPQTTARLRPL